MPGQLLGCRPAARTRIPGSGSYQYGLTQVPATQVNSEFQLSTVGAGNSFKPNDASRIGFILAFDVLIQCMATQYKRRTMSETEVLAQNLFRSLATQHLSADEVEEFRQAGLISSGGPKIQWESMLGRPVSEGEFYEYQLCKPSEICPYVEKIYAVILVSRNRDNENCYVQWKPKLEPYEGPWFS